MNCQLRNSTLLYPICMDPTENTVSQQIVMVLTVPFPRNGRPTVPRYASEGTCIATRCLAMGMARTKRKRFLHCLFYCCVRVFRALPRNGSACHNLVLKVHWRKQSGSDVSQFQESEWRGWRNDANLPNTKQEFYPPDSSIRFNLMQDATLLGLRLSQRRLWTVLILWEATQASSV
jgi:hypothetical protein